MTNTQRCQLALNAKRYHFGQIKEGAPNYKYPRPTKNASEKRKHKADFASKVVINSIAESEQTPRAKHRVLLLTHGNGKT